MKDFLGREITAGCHVVYPVRRNYTVNMRRMTVSQINKGSIAGYNPEGRFVSVSNVENLVVVQSVEPSAEASA